MIDKTPGDRAPTTETAEPGTDQDSVTATAAPTREESPAAIRPEAEPPEVREPSEEISHDAGGKRQISISVRSLVVCAVMAALTIAVGMMTWLFIGAERKAEARERDSLNVAHAEKVALEYATKAAAMNFQDLDGWKVKLVAGTSPELKSRLNKAAEQMQQILVPLQWDSTAQPLAAKVRSANGGIYVVDSFVSVQTKTVQSPDALQSTATYSVTIDSTRDWQITDVGGIGATVGGK